MPPMVGQYASLGVLIPELDSICVYWLTSPVPDASQQPAEYECAILTGRIVASGKP